MTKARGERRAVDCYVPSDRLVNYLSRRLRIQKRLEQLGAAGKADIPSPLQSELNNSNRMKTYYLNNVIYPSMANIVFFLEFIAKNKELQEESENDIKELFGMKYPPEYSESQFFYDDNNNPPEYQPIFFRFLQSVFTWDGLKKPNNFRVRMMYLLLHIIDRKVDEYLGKDLPQDVYGMMTDDVLRSIGWFALLSQVVPFDKTGVTRPSKF